MGVFCSVNPNAFRLAKSSWESIEGVDAAGWVPKSRTSGSETSLTFRSTIRCNFHDVPVRYTVAGSVGNRCGPFTGLGNRQNTFWLYRHNSRRARSWLP